MLPVPDWTVRNHASCDDYVYELMVQDQPLNIFMESLSWTESLHHPIEVPGKQDGLTTKRKVA